jgi:hypothetical protein
VSDMDDRKKGKIVSLEDRRRQLTERNRTSHEKRGSDYAEELERIIQVLIDTIHEVEYQRTLISSLQKLLRDHLINEHSEE